MSRIQSPGELPSNSHQIRHALPSSPVPARYLRHVQLVPKISRDPISRLDRSNILYAQVANANRPSPHSNPPRPASVTSSIKSDIKKYAPSISSVESTSSLNHGISEKYYLTADPSVWADMPLSVKEEDDYLHNPDPRRDRFSDKGGPVFTSRGLRNLGCMFILGVGLISLFAGYPLATYFAAQRRLTNLGAYNLGGINATGQVPDLVNFFGVIDRETPDANQHHTSFDDGSQWDLVFSDEFNMDGRSFYPGDDPYWEAVDLHYWQTNNLEWYDPAAITTNNGALNITLSNVRTHDLDYQGGLLQSWNKFCFTGGYIEVSVSLPGDPEIPGLWPAIWTMGNLGRAGYGASLEGTWPYSYDSCDVGTLANQTLNGQPLLATVGGDPQNLDALSYLPGQRLSACTCPGEEHPGPFLPDGTFRGRSAPEIDIFEATVNRGIGKVSQSGQWAPFDDGYNWANSSVDATVYNSSVGGFNNYRGGAFQETTSALMTTDQEAYSGVTLPNSSPKFATYGFEYKPGLDGYITWVNDGVPSWTVRASAVGANERVNISARPIPEEPMYIMANLGISPNFGEISPELTFPAYMLVDYIRVYQHPDRKNIGCSPQDFPTEDYINSIPKAYNNPNLTVFADAGKAFPKNRLIDTCTK